MFLLNRYIALFFGWIIKSILTRLQKKTAHAQAEISGTLKYLWLLDSCQVSRSNKLPSMATSSTHADWPFQNTKSGLTNFTAPSWEFWSEVWPTPSNCLLPACVWFSHLLDYVFLFLTPSPWADLDDMTKDSWSTTIASPGLTGPSTSSLISTWQNSGTQVHTCLEVTAW